MLFLMFPALQLVVVVAVVVDNTTCCMKTSRRCCWPRRRTTSAAAAGAVAGIINQSNCTMRWGAQGTQLSHYRDRLGDWMRLELDEDSMGIRCGFASLPSVLLFLSLSEFSSTSFLRLFFFPFFCLLVFVSFFIVVNLSSGTSKLVDQKNKSHSWF